MKWLELTIGLGPIVVAIVAVIISIISLKQTQRSIEEANRPYVVVYRDYVQVLDSVKEYLVIKNFGNTGAIIDTLEFDRDYLDRRKKPLFKNINKTFIAPGQAISTVVTHNAFEGDRVGIIKVNIKYHTGKRKFEEDLLLNDDLLHDLTFSKSRPSKNQTVEEVIAKTATEILRRNL